MRCASKPSPSELTLLKHRLRLVTCITESVFLRRNCTRYYFRDKQGLEVDFVVDGGNRRMTLIEAKATRTPMPDDARSLLRLAAAVKRYTTAAYVVHLERAGGNTAALCPGVKTVEWKSLGAAME